MLTLGPIAFTAPWLLLGLAALPILWLLLRAVPPAPIRRRFPGVALLLGLRDDESQSDRTPWWLLLLRMVAAALVILGFAGPLLNPQTERTGSGPLLILTDASWADARGWPDRSARIEALLVEAGRAGRPTALVALTDLPPGAPEFRAAEATLLDLPSTGPAPFAPGFDEVMAWSETFEGSFDTYWISDGLDRESRDPLLTALRDRGDVTVFQSPRRTLALRPARFDAGDILVEAIRTPVGDAFETEVAAIGLDPAGIERRLATAPAIFEPGEGTAEVVFDLPPELRNRISRFEVTGISTAGAVTLADDALRRREVALIAGSNEREGLELLSPTHYLEQALAPVADLIDGTISDVLLANPDVIILADVAGLAAGEDEAVQEWIEAGGLLVRFAGPRLAGSDLARTEEHPLLPVRLRAGGRSVGGAMSWGEPKALAPFEEDSPFFGLDVPDDVSVTAQVVAQPDPTLAQRVIAQLSDGTPLVTRKPLGEGQVVLFHVTANAEWSSLPLSGLFVDMLERLAVSTRPAAPTVEDLAGTIWVPELVLDARGNLERIDTLTGVEGERIATARPGPDLLPGLYTGEDRRLAVNAVASDDVLSPALWPSDVTVEGLELTSETDLKGWILAGALALLLADIVASLALSGRLRGPRAGIAVVLAALFLTGAPEAAQAQDTAPALGGAESAGPDADDDLFAISATREVILAHVLTGDARVDQIAEEGLLGLSIALFRRTAVEPALPVGIDIEEDELAFFPILYWPVTAGQPIPSREAYAKLNRYLRSGGMIVFDTRDADMAGFGSGSPEGRKLQALARPLDIPPIAPIPEDHVLTRTFYLLQDFPGRYASRDIWVEASPPDAELAEGMPFRDLNDGVTPVVIGGNDWASAWATDEFGTPLYPVGRGMAGERQREIAMRFGINLVIHVLTGNYKSDQVHVPALLDRLGQ
ncbi:DUF4159 domain-containing protein [Ponticoccus sp. SC2-23]|uniref:DUF4159 domain-containing protein n=1 Tax=Alexandriicola marinus TaxID=2081710 RepID=UPI000FD7384E|nr:DUF4159 domain-containing protein [Alexandriicola marinus]MBM1220279.1 DUF4159 domain-containing protein [Ponticoccus sp. SC6-9]MBM1224965.1 DUF4159 domain-containing protein [Ponticoccus sp. SC6-15]MBM1228479.1 DUF4159 domain-containing protein [Ponticoccus sp. SC6-38]MBM1233884.1 DUF4159 domain-containing protein [Ponticoccus sp. SC6-45]MBM1238980.1 DUF4159 domain-containing protein [Ponticoccus sp. SC6-49]MBM1242762.1 DUF4159 domain-containing protein [Ponticoccus sp. SC2-64]MBM1247408